MKRKDNNQTIWKAGTLNEFGQWKDYTLGNNLLKTQKSYNAYGQLKTIQTKKISDGTYRQNLGYLFNIITGNLDWRGDNRHSGCSEYFEYDDLNRITRYNFDVGPDWDLTYDNDNEGNISSKALIGEYTYAGTPSTASLAQRNLW